MIIDSRNETQKSILTNKCFYQTTAQIMNEFERKGYANSADETMRVITAYQNIVQNKTKNNFSRDYNEAFKKIDDAIKGIANKLFYDCGGKSLDNAYQCFLKFDYVDAIIGRQRTKNKNK